MKAFCAREGTESILLGRPVTPGTMRQLLRDVKQELSPEKELSVKDTQEDASGIPESKHLEMETLEEATVLKNVDWEGDVQVGTVQTDEFDAATSPDGSEQKSKQPISSASSPTKNRSKQLLPLEEEMLDNLVAVSCPWFMGGFKYSHPLR